MMNIRPVSDLRNKFPEVEEMVLETIHPVFLTKNGYGTMVLMSIEQYTKITDTVEKSLDEADKMALENAVRDTKEAVFGRIRGRIYAAKKI